MKVKIFLEHGAQLPKCAHDSDYGYDVVATSVNPDEDVPNGCIKYGTGIHVDFPPYYNGKKVCMQAFARSSVCKMPCRTANLSNGR